ncbi:MAG TPA: hypothetical protein VG756_18125 [Pseudonocardiaceae bacterium]|nr:hypothetical protein [Pseudonocardiaceae bacterium]
MFRADRELLARLSAANQSIAPLVLHLLGNLDEGELRADDLDRLGRQLRELGEDLIARAKELRPSIESG